MDQKERKRKRALIVLQIVIYGYLLTMFGSSSTCIRPGVVGVVNCLWTYQPGRRTARSASTSTTRNRAGPTPGRQVDDRRRGPDGHVGPGLFGLPMFLRGVWLQRQARRRSVGAADDRHADRLLVLIDGMLNSLGWALDLVANHTLINRC